MYSIKKYKLLHIVLLKTVVKIIFNHTEHVSGVGEMLLPLESKPSEPLKSRVLRICKKKTTVYIMFFYLAVEGLTLP